jgi:hypothetical protein
MEYDEDGKPLPVIDRRKDELEEASARSVEPFWRKPVEPVDQSITLERLRRGVARMSPPVDVTRLPVRATADEGHPAIAAMTVSEMAKRGGHARWATLSPARRSEIARAAARKRWEKQEG